jgi:hypothetical protein
MKEKPTISIQITESGNLELHANIVLEKLIKKVYGDECQTSFSENHFILKYLLPLGFEQITPESCGALTDAPMIRDKRNGFIYAFMDYQIKSFLEELAEGHSVIWLKG